MNNVKADSAMAARQRPSPYVRPAGQTSALAGSKPQQQPLAVRKPGASSSMPVMEHVPVNDLVQLARKAFSQKEFATALQFLSRALAVAPKDINLMDSRAACLEKLDRLDDALVVAKTMIQTYPQNPK